MTWETIFKWAPLASIALNAGFYFFLWLMKETLVQRSEFIEAISMVSKRVAHLEEIATAAPGWEVLNALRDTVVTLNGEVKAATERIEGLKALLARTEDALIRVQEHLMEAERKT